MLLTAAFLGVAGLERFPRLRFAPQPFLRPFLGTDAVWYVLATGSAAVSALVLAPALEGVALPGAGDRLGHAPAPVRFAVALVLLDLVAFAVHVALHRFDVLWAVHKVHHSSLALDWLATTRTHLFEHLVRNLPGQALLLMAGVPAASVATAAGVYALFAVLNHSNLRVDLSRLEAVLVTPRLHRRHHVPATTEKNFGTVFSCWDRLFGSLAVVDTGSDEQFGVPGERDSYPQRLTAALRQPARELLGRRRRQRRGQGCPRVAHGVGGVVEEAGHGEEGVHLAVVTPHLDRDTGVG